MNIDIPLEETAQRLRRNVADHLRQAMQMEPERYGKQAQVAEAAGISQSSVSRILKAQQGVTLEMLAAVARFTGTVAYKLLLDLPDGPNPPGVTSEGQKLMRRLVNAPRQEAPREIGKSNAAAKPGASGVHSHSQKPRPRKRRSSAKH